MGILEMIGLGRRSTTRRRTTQLQSFNVGLVPLSNPFPGDREAILAFDSELMSIAATGNHQAFNRSLQAFLTKLTLYNSNVSRYLVRGIRERADLQGSGFTTADADAVKGLFQEHNSAYISIRGMIKALQQESPLAVALGERTDDLSVLDDDQSRIVYGELLNIRLSLSVIEEIWVAIQPYEDRFFDTARSNS